MSLGVSLERPYPDFEVCDSAYGTDLSYSECLSAAEQFPKGTRYERWGTEGYPLPFQRNSGHVYITVEKSGRSVALGMLAVPNILYIIAVALCYKCVQSSGRGGFATQDFIYAVDWATEHGPPFEWRQIPPIGAEFLTITISGPTGKLFTPGNTDPAIPAVIAKTVLTWNKPKDGSGLPEHELERAEFWKGRCEEMQRGGKETWWAVQPPLEASSMSYQCDGLLGSPASVDCAQIEWNQLGLLSDMLNIESGVLFLHHNACFLAISAAVPLVITWNQIRVAMSALMNLCIEVGTPQGGRAYFKPQQNLISGRKEKHKRQSQKISGLNALPPNLNITIFEQLETWTNPTSELNTCTWKAISSGRTIESCNSK